jgi:hypothetical protein
MWLDVECLLSGPMGGDLQIGARLAVGQVQAVVFLRDPMTPQPHEPDINALVRACDVHDAACATNPATARLLLWQIESEGPGPDPTRVSGAQQPVDQPARASTRLTVGRNAVDAASPRNG